MVLSVLRDIADNIRETEFFSICWMSVLMFQMKSRQVAFFVSSTILING